MAASAAPRPRVIFLSYSRKDGSATAHRLRDVLGAAGYAPWLDTDQIEGGASWSRVIEDALNECDVLIAVLSEGSFVSEICRAEQMWALDNGKQVIPVLATRNARRPAHLYSLNFRTLPADESQLLADLGSEWRPSTNSFANPLRYNTIPPLPPNFISRENAVSDLRNLLFTEGEETNIAVTAVAGMGGIGKTVLATVLCRDIVVQRLSRWNCVDHHRPRMGR